MVANHLIFSDDILYVCLSPVLVDPSVFWIFVVVM